MTSSFECICVLFIMSLQNCIFPILWNDPKSKFYVFSVFTFPEFMCIQTLHTLTYIFDALFFGCFGIVTKIFYVFIYFSDIEKIDLWILRKIQFSFFVNIFPRTLCRFLVQIILFSYLQVLYKKQFSNISISYIEIQFKLKLLLHWCKQTYSCRSIVVLIFQWLNIGNWSAHIHTRLLNANNCNLM